MLKNRIAQGAIVLLVAFGAWLAVAMTGYPSALKPRKYAPQTVLIDNVRLISMVPGAPEAQPNQAVLVLNGEIKAVGPAGSLTAPSDALIINAAGKTLLPGLIDAHVHIWDEAELAGYLAHGVTGIRNMSGMPFHLPLKQRIEHGRILGPDFITTGPIINSPGPNQQDNHILVTTADEARAEVRKQHAAGYTAIKVYSNLRRAPFMAVLDEADKLGMTVCGHTPEGARSFDAEHNVSFAVDFSESVGRFTTIEHVESIVWHGLHDKLDADAMQELAQELAAAHQAVTPTLIAHDNLVRVARSKGAYLDRPGTDTINPVLKLFTQGTYDYWSQQDPDAWEAPRARFYLKATKILHDAGVPLIVGTDAGIFTNIPGSSMTRELELLVKSGLTPHEALEDATRTSAEVLGFDKTGMIAPGYRANLLLVSSDPLANISRVENPAGVMVHGIWLDEDALADLAKGAAQTSYARSARHFLAMVLDK